MKWQWLGALLALALAWGGWGTQALAADPETVGLVDPVSGEWFLRMPDGTTAVFFYGNPGDVPFMGDWNCDGVDTPGLYRQSDGFVYLRNSNTQGVADIRFFFGDPGDVPLPGDFDDDGCDTISVYRPSEGRVFIINRLGADGGNLGEADFSYWFGVPGDRPFVGDFDGDGVDEVGLHRISTGQVFLRMTHTTGFADVEFFYGNPDDRLVAGDWNGDGTGTVGIFRPTDAMFYLRNSNSLGVADRQFCYGQSLMQPVAGRFGGSSSTTFRPCLDIVARGLQRPLFLTSPPEDPRLFVVEQAGRIRVIENGHVLASPFLDIRALVDSGGERGLLGLAFHPDYTQNGRLFVNYTDLAGDTRVVEYQVSGDPNAAEPATARLILFVDQPFPNHNGGMLEFGADKNLYVSLGDGGGAGDPQENAENPGTLLGSILRLDVDSGDPYAVPPDNPFVSGGGRGEVWAYGLRNPWRFSFDRVAGSIYIGDVGQNAWEEVDVAPAGVGGIDYGWDRLEGAHCFEPSSGCDSTGTRLPVLEYPRPDEGCAVVGGYVYRGVLLPELDGTYFYSDFCGGWIRSFRHQGGQAVELRDWTAMFGTLGNVLSFGEDAARELYVLSADGVVRRLAGRD